MNIAYAQVIEAIEALDPATFSAITSLEIITRAGTSFVTNDVTHNRSVIYARSAVDPDTWRMIPVQEISHIEVSYDRSKLDKDCEPTLAGVIEYGKTR